MSETPLQHWENRSYDSSLYNLAKGYLSDVQFELAALVLVYMLQLINIAALIGNSLNIVVFMKLGFSESSNISLTALAASDLVWVVMSVWSNVCFLLSFEDARLPFQVLNVSFLTSSTPYLFVGRTVAWITAFISFERCLCILAPLKVKSLITPKITSVVVLVITTLTFGPVLLTYLRYNFVWLPYMNATILDVAPNDNAYFIIMEKIVLGGIQPISAFSIVLVCTVFLVVQLRKFSSWRKSVMSAKGQWGHKSGQNLASSLSAVGQDKFLRERNV
ncbi:chemosensory receptor b [Plakobranchus ocellatus]|uniref:Chemosensory receptor b n=1 Tax=Plakobranchus ocellatus TaxID=259542 RepID=A0AAV4A4T9_9GAST|nr:chemosensory receptor b [Plakobranchus ocellatus]